MSTHLEQEEEEEGIEREGKGKLAGEQASKQEGELRSQMTRCLVVHTGFNFLLLLLLLKCSLQALLISEISTNKMAAHHPSRRVFKWHLYHVPIAPPPGEMVSFNHKTYSVLSPLLPLLYPLVHHKRDKMGILKQKYQLSAVQFSSFWDCILVFSSLGLKVSIVSYITWDIFLFWGIGMRRIGLACVVFLFGYESGDASWKIDATATPAAQPASF